MYAACVCLYVLCDEIVLLVRRIFRASARHCGGGVYLGGLLTAALRTIESVAALISDVLYDRLCSQARRVGCGIESGVVAWCDRRRCRRRLLVLPSRVCAFRCFGVFHKEQPRSKPENISRNASKMRHIIHTFSKNILYSASDGECFAETFYASYKNFFGYVSRFL